MATYYWVGGSGNWNATSTANWSNASGGSSGFGPPTSADDVIFDAGSNVGTNPFTVTVTGTSSAPAVCRDFSTGGAGGALDGAMTLAFSNATSVLAPYGSVTLPATNLSVTGVAGSILRLLNATSATLTTNGVSLSQINNITIAGGGVITLGSALTAANINPTSGTLDTANYNVTLNQLITSGALAKSIILGSSSVVCAASTPIDFTNTTGFTFNAGTSTITCSATSPTFSGGGQTFYNVTFSSTASGTATINGANTFNNLTFTSVGGTGYRFIILGANQTVSGTLTFGTGNTAIRRMRVVSDTIGTRRTITLNGTLASVSDVDFRDIGAAGTVATPWTGTRLGDCKNNNNITFAAPKTVYWNLAGTQNWSATGWALTNTGVPAVNNFPLAQDTATFTEAGAAGTVSIEANWQIGTIQMADGVSNRTTAFTLNIGASPSIYGNMTLFSNLVISGTGTSFFVGQGVTQVITSAGRSFTNAMTVNSTTGTVQLFDNLTNTNTAAPFTLSSGTLDLNGKTLTCVSFDSNNTGVRTIAFGSGNVTANGNNRLVWTTDNSTNLTVTGTPVVNLTYSGAVGTRTFVHGSTGGTEANSISFNVSAGTDTVTSFGANRQAKNLDFTGFSGTLANTARIIYGNLTLSSGMTLSAGSNTLEFRATSGTQTVTSNGKTMDFPINSNTPGATVLLADNMTVGSTRTFFLTAGTLDLGGNKVLSTGVFSSGSSNTRTIAFGTGNITVTGNNSVVFNMAAVTGFTYTGTSNINLSYSGSVGTRTMNFTTGGTEANSLNFNITAGTDIIALPFIKRNMDFTGFSGTMLPGTSGTTNFYGDLKLNTGMTVAAGGTTFQFLATSGTQNITSNGKTIDTPFLINAPGAVVRFADALTQGATRLFEFSSGTLEFTVGTTSTFGSFVTSGTTPKTLRSTNSGRRATLFQDSGAVNATYVTIKDISATSNGVYWDALVGSGAINGGNNIGWNFVPPTTVIGQKAFQFDAFQNNAFQIPVWLNNVDVFFYWDGQSDDSSAWTVQPNASSPWTVQ
jgi:hypothetical protein